MSLLEHLDFDLVGVGAEDLERILDRFVNGRTERFCVLELDQLLVAARRAARRPTGSRRRRARSGRTR
jgi:hypothetical protein